MRTRRLSALVSLAAAVALGGLALNPMVGMATAAEGNNASLTIDERATMGENGQEVQVSGTYSCGQGNSAVLVVAVLQSANNSEKRIFGHERDEVPCPADTQKWTMNVSSADSTVPFEAGTAQVSVTMKIDNKKTRSHREIQISR